MDQRVVGDVRVVRAEQDAQAVQLADPANQWVLLHASSGHDRVAAPSRSTQQF
jgi:hypothetical protein